MIASVHLLEDFFRANVPSVQTLLLAGPPALLWAAFCLHLAGRMKALHGWKTGYTRKLFHFLIFGTVVAAHRIWGLPGVCLFGGMTTLVLAFALWRGAGHPWYEALAREKDAPRRTHYVVVPYAATLLGGLAANIFFPDTAVFGYLVTGLGDAVAEPVGTRFGRRLYRVPAMTGVHAVRSLEGSAAVFLASALSLTMAEIPSDAYKGAFVSFFGPQPIYLIFVVLLTSLGTWGLPQMIGKFYAIKNEGAIQKGTIISTVFAIIVAGGCYFLGGFGRLFQTQQQVDKNGFDAIIPAMLSHLPDILIAIVLILV